jgi:TetR/AcrR family transcriptional repressor of mexJK operon
LEQEPQGVPARKLAKQVAMASAACTVFGREGYARASVDTLAEAAGVSTRTLYNHFPGGKAQLFQTVVSWTSGQVRDAQLALIDAFLAPERPPHADDLERDLVALGHAFVGLMAQYPDHFALVRHIHSEADHVPPSPTRACSTCTGTPGWRAATSWRSPRTRSCRSPTTASPRSRGSRATV